MRCNKISDIENGSEAESLKKMVLDLLEFRECEFQEDVKIQGRHGQKFKLNYVFRNSNSGISSTVGIIIKDWKRSCGYNCILEAERVQKDTLGLNKIMIVANRFSDTAKDLADRLKIITLTSGELNSIFNIYNVKRDDNEVIEP